MLRTVPRRLLTGLLLATLATGAAPLVANPTAASEPTVRLIVSFKDNASSATQDSVAADEGDLVQSLKAIDARVIEVPASFERLVRKRLLHRSDVKTVEDDVILHATSFGGTNPYPNDTIYTSNTSTQAPQVAVHLPEAWDVSTGSSSTVIAVIDTGVSPTGTDLPSSKFLTGYNALNGTTNTADDNGHGTMAASVATMIGNNTGGAAGACWQCRILPVKVLSSSGSGTTSGVAAGINWVVANHPEVKVMSLSLAGGGTSTLKAAVDNAESHGVTVVAAAGNSGTTSTVNAYPAAYSNVISVGGTGSNNSAAATNSNRGTWVRIAAPYTDVALTKDNGLVWFSGTSAATPVVSGTIGLLLGNDPTLKPAQLRALLPSTATKPISMLLMSGSGLLNARAALDAVGGTAPTSSTSSSSTSSTSSTSSSSSSTSSTSSTSSSSSSSSSTSTTATTATTQPTGTQKTVSGSAFTYTGTVALTQAVLTGPITLSSCSTCRVGVYTTGGQLIGSTAVGTLHLNSLAAGTYQFRSTGRAWSTVSITLTYQG